jgi:hypothetical protein
MGCFLRKAVAPGGHSNADWSLERDWDVSLKHSEALEKRNMLSQF